MERGENKEKKEEKMRRKREEEEEEEEVNMKIVKRSLGREVDLHHNLDISAVVSCSV